jgi:hypothetical protein
VIGVWRQCRTSITTPAYWHTFVPLQLLELQTDPAQHWLVLAPQATQRLVPVWQTKGSPQNPPEPRFGAQQG